MEMSEEDLVKVREVQLLAMPITRMLDYGMDYADALALSRTPPEVTWAASAAALAEQQLARAGEARAAGRMVTAAACFRRAAANFAFAQMAFNADNAEKIELYRRLTDAYAAAADADPDLNVDRVEVPAGSSASLGWLVQPLDRPVAGVVLIIGGQSGWGASYHLQAEALAKRGLAALLLEVPGQGATRLFNGLHLDASVDGVFSAALDLLGDRDDVGHRFGVWGNSFGGLLAARAAVHDDRILACCVNGADLRPVPFPFRTAQEQAAALTGAQSDDEVEAILRTLWLSPPADRINAPLLVIQGGMDPLCSLDQAKEVCQLSDDAILRIWDGGEHTIYNHSAERTEVVTDWFAAMLTGS